MAEIAAAPDSSETGSVDGYLEVLDRANNVVDRFAVSSLPVSVGRAYDNDLVVADPFVCPHHLTIDRDETGETVAADRNSINGLFAQRTRHRVQSCVLTDGQPIRFGHTRLRYRSRTFQVDATLPDHHTRKALGVFESPGLQLLVFASTLLILWASGFLDSVEIREASEPAFDVIVPVTMIVVWAGLWAFAGRVVTHRIKFLAHCAIISSALTALLLIDTGIDYIAFSLSVDEVRSSFGLLTVLLIASVLLYSHLRFATLLAPWRLAMVSSAIACAVVGLLYLKTHIDSDEFSASPNLQATLKAPQFKVAQGRSTTEFFGALEGLHGRVRLAAQAEPNL